MPGLTVASGLDGWSYGGSILTFAFPMILFIFVAAGLYVVFTKPHVVPGHRYQRGGGQADGQTDATSAPTEGAEGK